MEITIWSQFSSNHSADFTVVGVFETVEDARKASGLLREELVKIASWFENPANQDAIQKVLSQPDFDDRQPFPPEIELDAKYQTGFSYAATDWLWYSDEAERAVIRFENMVFISNYPTSFRTWSGDEPFEKLMASVGGEVGCDCIVVRGTARNVELAKQLYSLIIQRAKGQGEMFVPWLVLTSYNSEPTTEVIEISFSCEEPWEDCRKMRDFFNRFGCTNITFKVYRECEDLEKPTH